MVLVPFERLRDLLLEFLCNCVSVVYHSEIFISYFHKLAKDYCSTCQKSARFYGTTFAPTPRHEQQNIAMLCDPEHIPFGQTHGHSIIQC